MATLEVTLSATNANFLQMKSRAFNFVCLKDLLSGLLFA